MGGHLCYTRSWEEEDRKAGLSSSRRTALIIVAMMNDIFNFLNFTIELGEDFVDGKLPSLDINIWVVNGRLILFEHFEKTMASNLVVEAKSALSKEVKLATLSEEIARRLRNTSQRLDSARRLEIVEHACVKMKTSGHSDTIIRQAVEQGIRSNDNKVKRSLLDMDDPAYQPLFPKAGWKKNLKAKAKALKRATWFRGDDDKKEGSWNPLPLSKAGGRVGKRRKIFLKAGKGKSEGRPVNATVVFVPSTRGGTLISSLKEDEDRMAMITGFRVKYQEAGGSILANAFNTNLGSGQACGRDSCPPCEVSGGRVDCKARSIMYESKCLVCNPETSLEEADGQANQPSRTLETPREGIYIGESSRSLHERAFEHVRDAKAFSDSSHIVKHWMTSHPSLPNPPMMGFSITGRFKDCLSRQISEALRINMSRDSLLNSKREFGHNSVSRLTVTEDMRERRERERLEEEQEELNKRMVAQFRIQKSSQHTPSSASPSPSIAQLNTEPYLARRGSVNTLTGTLCNIVQPQDENDNDSKKNHENDNEDLSTSPDLATTTGNRLLVEPKVTLGQSNWSPCTPLVYTKGGYLGQDEHPWLKWVPEGVDESGGGQEEGGKTGQDDLSVAPNVMYETDEEEFLESVDTSPKLVTLGPATKQRKVPDKKKNTAIRNVPAQGRGKSDYNLSYFNLWWTRMAVESRKEAKEAKRRKEEVMKAGMRRMYKNIKRITEMGDAPEHRIELAQSQINSQNVSKSQQIGQGGSSLNGGSQDQGEGGREGVPVDDVIFERSQDSRTHEKLKYGTQGLNYKPEDERFSEA